MSTQKVRFLNRKAIQIVGVLDIPDDQAATRWALLTHCFTCTKDLRSLKNIANILTSFGFGVLRFDFSGLGESGGEFHETTFETNIEDIEDAALFLKSSYGEAELGIGHSLGGAALIHAAKALPALKGIVTMGTPFDPAEIERHFIANVPEIRELGSARVQLAGRPFIITQAFLDDLEGKSLGPVLANLTIPLLVVQPQEDSVVDPQNGQKIYDAKTGERQLLEVENTNHLMMKGEGAERIGQAIVAWFDDITA